MGRPYERFYIDGQKRPRIEGANTVRNLPFLSGPCDVTFHLRDSVVCEQPDGLAVQ
jgi:hypothetical protein